MTTLEFLQLREFYKFDSIVMVRKHMITADGTEISIQRGPFHSSSPKVPMGAINIDPPYPIEYDYDVETVEVGLFGNRDMTKYHPLMAYCGSLDSYFDDPGNELNLYAFYDVPLDVVDDYIEEHGGYAYIKNDRP